METITEVKKEDTTLEPPDLVAIKRLEKLFQEETEENEVHLKEHADDIYYVLMNALKTTDVRIMQTTLVALGQALHAETWVNSLTDKQCDVIISELCSIIQDTSDKPSCTRALWCFYSQTFKNKIILSHLKPIWMCISKRVLLVKFGPSCLQFEAIRALRQFLNTVPLYLSNICDTWWKIVSHNLVHPAAKVRLLALDIIIDYKNVLCQNPHIMNLFVFDVQQTIVPEMMKLFSENEEKYVLKLWIAIVSFFGKILHHGSTLINLLLKVIEKAFKSPLEEVRIAAFQSWQELIDNFAIESDVISSVKRLNVLLQPLHACHARTENSVKAVIFCWWHLICALESNLPNGYELVFESLLQFCLCSRFKSSTPVNLRRLNLNLSFGPINDSAKGDQLPLDELLASYGLQVLGRLFEASCGSSAKITHPLSLGSLSHPVMSGSTMFLKHGSNLLQAVERVSCIRWSESGEIGLISYIWQNLASCVKMLANSVNDNDCNQKEAAEFISSYFCTLGRVIREGKLNCKTILAILEAASFLPTRLLLSSAFSLDGNNLLNGTPGLFLLKMLISKGIVEEVGTDKTFLAVFSRLTTFSSLSTCCFLNSIYSAIEIVDTAAPYLKLDTSFNFWNTLTSHLMENIEHNQEVNQGDALEHDFSCIYAILIHPFKHLFVQSVSVIMKRTIWKKWDKLYENFACCAALVCDIEANVCCYELASKLRMIFLGKSQLVEFEDWLHSIETLLKSFQWPTVNNTAGIDGRGTSFKGGKNKINDQFSLTPVIRLISTVIDSFVDHLNLKWDSVSGKASVVTTALQLIDILANFLEKLRNDNLITAIKLFTPQLMQILKLSMLNSVFEEPSVLSKIADLWGKLTRMLPLNYRDTYNTKFLNDISPLLEATLKHKRHSIRVNSRLLWQDTFASSYDTLTLPTSLREVLQQTRPLIEIENLSPDSEMQVFSLTSPTKTIGEALQSGVTTRNSPKVTGSFLNKPKPMSAGKQFASPCTVTTTKSSASKSSKSSNVDDMDSQDFVVINSATKVKHILTEHQKEMACRRSLIPAMYADLSQDSRPVYSESPDVGETQQSISEIEQHQDKTKEQSLPRSVATETSAPKLQSPRKPVFYGLSGAVAQRSTSVLEDVVIISSDSDEQLSASDQDVDMEQDLDCTPANLVPVFATKNDLERHTSCTVAPTIDLRTETATKSHRSELTTDTEKSAAAIGNEECPKNDFGLQPFIEICKLTDEELGRFNSVRLVISSGSGGLSMPHEKVHLTERNLSDDDLCLKMDLGNNADDIVAETFEFQETPTETAINAVPVTEAGPSVKESASAVNSGGPCRSECSANASLENGSNVSDRLLEEMGHSRFVEIEIQSSSSAECPKIGELDRDSFNSVAVEPRLPRERIPEPECDEIGSDVTILTENRVSFQADVGQSEDIPAAFPMVTRHRKQLAGKCSAAKAKLHKVKKTPGKPPMKTRSSNRLNESDVVNFIKARRRSLSDREVLSESSLPLCEKSFKKSGEPQTRAESVSVPSEKSLISNDNRIGGFDELPVSDQGNTCSSPTKEAASDSVLAESPQICLADPSTLLARVLQSCPTIGELDWTSEGVPFDSRPLNLGSAVSDGSFAAADLADDISTDQCQVTLTDTRVACDPEVSRLPGEKCPANPVSRVDSSPKKCDGIRSNECPATPKGFKRIAASSLPVNSRAAQILELAKRANKTDVQNLNSSLVEEVVLTNEGEDGSLVPANEASGTGNTVNEPKNNSVPSSPTNQGRAVPQGLTSQATYLVSASKSPGKGIELMIRSHAPIGSLSCASPSVSPSGILKKRLLTDSSTPTPPNKRRVSFADPPVQGEISVLSESPNRKSGRDVSRRLCMGRHSPSKASTLWRAPGASSMQVLQESSCMDLTQDSYQSPLITELNSTDCICPELVNCKESIDIILHRLTTTVWSRGLSKLMNSRSITTIGDLSALSEVDINLLPIRSPKVHVVRQALTQHLKSVKLNTEKGVSDKVDEIKSSTASGGVLAASPSLPEIHGPAATCGIENVSKDANGQQEDLDYGAMPSLEDELAQFSPVKENIKCVSMPELEPSESPISEANPDPAMDLDMCVEPVPHVNLDVQTSDPFDSVDNVFDSLEKLSTLEFSRMTSNQIWTRNASLMKRLTDFCFKLTVDRTD